MWTYKCDRCGAALDPGERCDCQDRPAKYNGKPIFTQENFNYLDVAVFGYLLAVKRWFARPDLYRYEFTTIACAAMRSAIGNEQRKQSRRIKTVSLDDPIPGTDGMTWEDIITEDHLVYSA